MLSDINEAASALAVKKATLRKWVQQKRIPFVKLGRCVRFDVEELVRFFKNKSER